MTERIDDATRAMFDLVREVRHDLNGPLTSALGNVQLMLEDPNIVDREVRESLGDIEADLRRLAGMIRRLTAIRPPEGD